MENARLSLTVVGLSVVCHTLVGIGPLDRVVERNTHCHDPTRTGLDTHVALGARTNSPTSLQERRITTFT